MTDKGVAALKPRAQRYAVPDVELRGHWIRVQPSGTKSYVTVARDPDSRQIWTTIASTDVMPIEEARERAREMIKRVRAGLPATTPRGETFGQVADSWLKRHVEANGLRTRREIVRLLDRHMLPPWRDREFVSIRRSDVTALLDQVEDGHGTRTADYVFTIARSLMNWFARRRDDYVPPLVRGMRRESAKARARVLDDDELRAVWTAADGSGTFGAIIKLCLLSAQRSRKVSTMQWADVSVDGEWTIPQEPREKDSAGSLVLPKIGLEIIRAQPELSSNPYVFAGRGAGPYRGFAVAKAVLDAKLPPDMPGWVIHDLRRTARSLMSRAGVRPDIAERVLGHVRPGVEATYDRHSYRSEKANALELLAALIDAIVHGRTADVLPMAKRKKRR
jgi:integrase